MSNGIRRHNSVGITAAALLISAALAIVISLSLNNWWILVPIILLEIGIYVLMIGLTLGRPSPGMPWTKSDSNFYLFWGNLLAAVGALLILNSFFPGNVIILIVVLLIWFAIFALVFSMRKKGG